MLPNDANDKRSAERFPPLTISVTDHRQLEAIALKSLLGDPRNAGALLNEIDRADIVEDDIVGKDVVGIGDLVGYRDDATGERHFARLVDRADNLAQEDTLSVLSSLGAALIGLRVGQSILWSDRLGTERVYTVLSVNGVVRPN